MNEQPDTIRAYRELDDLGVEIAPMTLAKHTAILRDDGLLVIDYSKIETEAEELEVLLHEIGHFETASFYTLDSPFADRRKQENKASRFVFEKYYPPEMLAGLMEDGYSEPWALSEMLGLPERFVREMVSFYTDVRQVDFSRMAKSVATNDDARREELEKCLDELARTRGIHFYLADDATADDVLESVRIVDMFLAKKRQKDVV